MKEQYDNFECDVPIVLNKFKDCPGQKLCSKCVWFDQNEGDCPGCTEDYKKRCIKSICAFTSCINCSGGVKVQEIGICGRAPESWRKRWDKLIEYSIPDYAPKPLNIKCRLIPIIYPQIKKYKIPEKFPEIDAWAVPIHKVANEKGEFHSNDLKDYLGLPSDRKLIFSTCAFDNYMEMLWRKGPEMNYKKHEIDYWFPAHFSIYDDDSKIFQFANAKRQQLHAVWTKSQFIWFRLGEHIPIEFLLPIRNASSVLISTSQMDYRRNLDILFNEVKAADDWFPQKTAFFVMGDHRRLPIRRARTCYQINTNWIMKGIMGISMEGKIVSGKLKWRFYKDMKIPKGKVLKNNLKEVLKYV